MMKYKKNIFILLISIAMFFILNFFYNSFILQKDITKVYVLKQDVTRGQSISMQSVETLYVKNNTNIKYLDETKFENFVFNDDFTKGQILTDSIVTAKVGYISNEDNTEIIAVKVNTPEDVVAYQIGKGSIVNIYYTGKRKQAMNILDANSVTLNSDLEDGYITTKLLDKIKVLEVFDKYGNKLDKVSLKNDNNVIDTLLIQVNKDMVLKINNLKNYGQFSFSVIS